MKKAKDASDFPFPLDRPVEGQEPSTAWDEVYQPLVPSVVARAAWPWPTAESMKVKATPQEPIYPTLTDGSDSTIPYSDH
jgi:hypothetical protein